MAVKMRGADLLVKTLSAAGAKRLFALSGNQVMSVFDACIDAGVELVHVRHEAAAVHMADAWGRLTGEPGVALVTAGPGMANTLSALYVAKMAESPLVVLSGHAPLAQLGLGAFHEMAQSDMARHVTKASWTATEASKLGEDVARAFALATSGRPGPVHVGLPVDLLEAAVDGVEDLLPSPDRFEDAVSPMGVPTAERVLDALAEAERPLVLGGPIMTRGAGPEATSALAAATHLPVVSTESPRGTNDPSLGAFAEVLSRADLVVLLGKKLDFTMRFGEPPAFDPGCRFIHVDPEEEILERTRRVLNGSPRLVLGELADPLPAAELLVQMAGKREWTLGSWQDEVQETISYRPPEWASLRSPPGGPIHPLQVCRAVQAALNGGDGAVFISDGAEFGQWAQACVSAPHRIINGPSGSIGSAIPFALAARLAFPASRVVAMLGDGTFGFHAMEFDTAVRYQLPFVAVVGNDSTWNAEYQIQLREYGPDRLIGCELLPSRYDQVAEALGGHGEQVSSAAGLNAAMERAFASGRPACVNAAVKREAAPTIRRGAE